MDTIEMVQNAILNFCEDAKIIPWNNGGIQVNVEDPTNIPGVIATVADVMYDYNLDDIQITTNQARCEVYIDICDREEDDDEDDEDFDGCAHNPIRVGDIINYRSNLVRVCSVDRKNKTVCISDPYGVVQTIDEEDFKYFNRDLEI